MPFNIGDLVTRNSYNNDTVFKMVDNDSGVAYLKGVNIKLLSDSELKVVLVKKKEIFRFLFDFAFMIDYSNYLNYYFV